MNLPNQLLYQIILEIREPSTLINLSMSSSIMRDLILSPPVLENRKKAYRRIGYLLREDRGYHRIKLLPNGAKDGKEKIFRFDGSLKHSISWREGEKDGLEETYYLNGKLFTRKTWKKGLLLLDEEWWEANHQRWHIKRVIENISNQDYSEEEGSYMISYMTSDKSGIETSWNSEGHLQNKIVWEKGIQIKE